MIKTQAKYDFGPLVKELALSLIENFLGIQEGSDLAISRR
ncbi:MAG: hypothetical protein ACJA1T_000033 [Zhongshania aliphaticivorans]|jgi:hypothetical protein